MRYVACIDVMQQSINSFSTSLIQNYLDIFAHFKN